MRTFPRLAIVCALLSGCAEFPQLDRTVDAGVRDAPYPTLVPVETITARIGADRITPDERSAAEARIAALRARAARLKRRDPDSGT